mmetsp:Transcript_22995/g.53152  ORF Transcript_22995/g.53152 Transcript_22995/m.53152 type:complete len:208 (-) Transcript_22995:485-1108(-)
MDSPVDTSSTTLNFRQSAKSAHVPAEAPLVSAASSLSTRKPSTRHASDRCATCHLLRSSTLSGAAHCARRRRRQPSCASSSNPPSYVSIRFRFFAAAAANCCFFAATFASQCCVFSLKRSIRALSKGGSSHSGSCMLRTGRCKPSELLTKFMLFARFSTLCRNRSFSRRSFGGPSESTRCWRRLGAPTMRCAPACAPLTHVATFPFS